MKPLMRLNVKNQLRTLSDSDKLIQSRIVCDLLLESAVFRKSKRLAVYLSTNFEINTDSIVMRAFEMDKHVFVPRFSRGHMDMVRLYSIDDYMNLPVFKWNIRQPKLKEERENALDITIGLDLIIVPGVAFTLKGDRLGHGNGYYDKYLANYEKVFKKRPCTLALAFKEQIFDHVPCNHYDYVIDKVLHA